MSIDLGRIHPLTGPVHVEGAEPGDILEVEVLDVAPLVDFGYVVLSPTVHLPLTLEARHGVPGQHRMTGRVAVITGSSRGIGAGLVTGYRGRGWAVVASALTIKPSPDPDLLTVAGNIAEPATADRIIDAALDRFGRLDTLVNNAGVFISKPFTDYTAADYALVTGVNLAGFFWLTRRAVAEMATRYGGHVVNITATLAEVADSGTPAVLAALTKGGLAAATRSLAVEYASVGIRVNAVSRASSRPRCTRPAATTTSAAGFPRSAARARSATWSTPSCSWSPRPTSPARSCTSTAGQTAGH